jgi:hypothetical protein
MFLLRPTRSTEALHTLYLHLSTLSELYQGSLCSINLPRSIDLPTIYLHKRKISADQHSTLADFRLYELQWRVDQYDLDTIPAF